MKGSTGSIGTRCLVAAALASWVVAACTSPEEYRKEILAKVERALAAGEPERAEEVLREALIYDPRDSGAATRLAQLLDSQGREREAYEVLTWLPDDAQTDVEYRKLLAGHHVRQGPFGKALVNLAALERMGQAEPAIVELLLKRVMHEGVLERSMVELPFPWRRRLVELLVEERKLVEAANLADRLPREDPERERLVDLVLGLALETEWSATVDRCPGLLDPPETPRKLLARHRYLVARGDLEEAGRVEETFVSRYPSHPGRYEILLTMARRMVSAGMDEEGLSLANKAAALAPGKADPLVERGVALDALGRKEEGRRAFDLALSIEPGNVIARRFLDSYNRRAAAPPPSPSGRLTIDLEVSGEVPTPP